MSALVYQAVFTIRRHMASATTMSLRPLRSFTMTNNISSACGSPGVRMLTTNRFNKFDHVVSSKRSRLGVSKSLGGMNNFNKHVFKRSSSSSQSMTVRCAVTIPALTQLKTEADQELVPMLGFTQVDQHYVGEYKAFATLYRHNKTGAEVMSVSVDDENKVFGVVLRTPPKDSTGIPHILEHSVLCGSRKYPLKEPFVELMKGSLQTFLNAFTYPDRTCYPVASTNLQDFYNLVDVYLDAVYFPNCVREPQTFEQEGWHYELNDPKEDITFKGVVFNEMKGVYSQPDSMLNRTVQQALFPDNTYGVDSGGDPAVIPDLTFEQFQEFHAKFYHPSNSRIWFYGDDDPDQRLRVLSEYLDKFESNSEAVKESEVQFQPLFPSPKKITASYVAGESAEAEGAEGTGRHMVSVNWLLSASPLPLQDQLALQFLDYLLLGTSASPLSKALLESKLGEALVGGGLSDELLQPTFSIGLKGVKAENVEAVEELALSTLQELEREGFSEEAVEAAMNSIEFSLRENNTGSFPRGLNLMLRSMGSWLYGRDPFEPLKFVAPLEELKERLKVEGAKGVFSPLIKNLILDNTHRVTVELKPDYKKGEEEEERERQRLAALQSSLSADQLAELASATKALQVRQETPDPPEALRKVPTLALTDIPKLATTIPIEVGSSHGATILRHPLVTNDVLYAEVAFDMTSLPPELLPLLPLFCQCLTEMGTKDKSFVELSQLIGRKTGGISVFPFTSSQRQSPTPVSYLVARGKSTAAQASDLLELLRVVLQDVAFNDEQRFKQFVAQAKQRMESRIRGGGHSIAATRLDAMYNAAGWASEQMGGFSYLEYLRGLEASLATPSGWSSILSSLTSLRSHLLATENAIVNLTADPTTLESLESTQLLEKTLLQHLPAVPESKDGSVGWGSLETSQGLLLPKKNEGLVIPTQVNYVGKAGNLYSEGGYELKGSAYVISKHLGTTWLWDRVRVSGGAYGGFCDFDSHSGVFTYLSYRDPNLIKTLDNYDGTVEFLRELKMDSDSLTKAIIGTIGDVDSYQLPDAKGYTSMMRYMLKISDEERQQRREEILSTTEKDFNEFADVLESVRKSGTVVTVASSADIAAANEERPGLLEVRTVL